MAAKRSVRERKAVDPGANEPAAREQTHFDADTWVRAALDVLARDGIDGVRVELLARNLGVTKGSFYWHFKDRDALYAAMIETWRNRAAEEVSANNGDLQEGKEDPRDRFRALVLLPFEVTERGRSGNLGLAFRLWAWRDERARAAVDEIDRLRTQYIANLIVACGAPAEEAPARAVLTYSCMRVISTLADRSETDLLSLCGDILLGEAGSNDAAHPLQSSR